MPIIKENEEYIMYDYMNITMFHGFGMLIFWFIVIFLIFSLFKSKKTKNSPKESSLDILKRRLVKGEITKEEYEDLKRIILQERK